MAEMVTPLELVRALLWEVDEAEALMVRQLRGEGQSRSFRKRLVARHRIRQLLDETTAKKVRLLRILKEEEPSQQERERERGDGEMGRRGGVECDASSFYDCVKQLRCGATVATTSWSKPELASTELLATRFSPEESFGRRLDLQAHFQRFLELLPQARTAVGSLELPSSSSVTSSSIVTPTYLEYLAGIFFNFEHPSAAPMAAICSALPIAHRPLVERYRDYLLSLSSYLRGFLDRVDPLRENDLSTSSSNSNPCSNSSNGSSSPASFATFCEACGKSFKSTVYEGHLHGKMHKAAERSLEAKRGLQRQVQALQHEIASSAQRLKPQIEATRYHTERKLSQLSIEYSQGGTGDEDSSSDGSDGDQEGSGRGGRGGGSSDDDEDEQVLARSIKQYPMGPDGKPLPYWMYKAQGLAAQYRCEICGNATYFGPKAFNAHFNNLRHAQGMKSLGIPYSQAFHMITKISHALSLWEAIQRKTRPDFSTGGNNNNVGGSCIFEEIEDINGKVISRFQ